MTLKFFITFEILKRNWPYITFLSVRPTLIVKVRIMNDHNDTTKRQFPVGTVLQITCQGQIGSDPNKVSIITIHY